MCLAGVRLASRKETGATAYFLPWKQTMNSEWSTSLVRRPWRIAAFIAVVANVAFNYLSQIGGQHTRSVSEVSALYPSLFTPAGYAFSIWGLIYASTIAYSISALLPSQRGVRMHDDIAPWLISTNLLGALWLVVFTREYVGLSVIVILAMLFACARMYQVANEHLRAEHLGAWWRVPFSLWLSWLSVASIANISVALLATGWRGEPFTPAVWTVIFLIVAGALGAGITGVFKDPTVSLVISWAAAAIAVARWEETLVATVAVIVATLALLWVAVISLWTRGRKGLDPQARTVQSQA